MVDYTSRDEQSLIAQADSYAKSLLPEWTSRDSEDINWVTLKTVARLNSILNFYVDLAFNENHPTAQLYSSLLRQAKSVNMPVKSKTGAVVTVALERVDTSTLKTIPRFSEVKTTLGTYVSTEEYVMGIGQNNVIIPFTFGKAVSGVLGTSTGRTLQSYVINNKDLQKHTLRVYVDGVQWQEELDVLAMRGKENVYKVWVEPDETLRIDFGDGEFGNIPTIGKAITWDCVELKGDVYGRVPRNSILSTSIDDVTYFQPESSTGGEPKESVESLQKNLVLWRAVQNRVVMPKDAVFMARRYPGVVDAKIRTNGLRYDVFIVTVGGDPTPQFLTDVKNYLDKRKLDIIELHTFALKNTNIVIDLVLKVDMKYKKDVVENAIKAKLMEEINASENSSKDVTIYDLYSYLNEFKDKGAENITITASYKEGLSQVLSDIIIKDDEKAYLPVGNINIISTGGL